MNKLFRFLIIIAFAGFFLSSCQSCNERKVDGQQNQDGKKSSEIEILNQKIKADTLNPEFYYDRSRYYLTVLDINNALADINKAIQLNDEKASYFVALSDIYLAMGKLPSCLDALKKAEGMDPADNEALLKLAEVYLILKDYNNTFEYTKKALELDLINPVAHFIRAYAHMEVGDTALAIQNFQAAADQDQNYYEAYIELGSLYLVLKDPLATGYFQTAIRIEPNRAEGYYLLGFTYQEMENIPGAIDSYEKLLVITPDFKQAHYNLGYINLVYVNDFEKAVYYFSEAISNDPAYTDAYFNRGYSYELMGDFVNARKDYLKTLEITPNYERSIEGLNRLDSNME